MRSRTRQLRSRPTRRTLALLVAFLLAASTLFFAEPASAQGAPVRDYGMEASFLASVNQQRAANGAAPLTLNGSMTNAAAQWAYSMANGSFLAHAGDIVSGTPGGWAKVGENVGRGKSVSSLTQAFMASPGHRRNMLDPEFTMVGIGVYIHPSGKVYTTHRFASFHGAAPAVIIAAPQPTAIPQPTPIPPPVVQPTPIPPPVVQPTPIPTPIPQPTAIPAPVIQPTAIPTTIPPPVVQPTLVPTTAPRAISTATPVEPTSEPVQSGDSPDTSTAAAPERLAFVDPELVDDINDAKMAIKTSKVENRGARPLSPAN